MRPQINQILKPRHFKQLLQDRGMALIELVIVIAIIGILASVSIPHLGFYKTTTEEMAVENYERMLHQKLRLYYVVEGKAISEKSDDRFYSVDQNCPTWMETISREPCDIKLNKDYQYQFIMTEGELYGTIKIKEK